MAVWQSGDSLRSWMQRLHVAVIILLLVIAWCAYAAATPNSADIDSRNPTQQDITQCDAAQAARPRPGEVVLLVLGGVATLLILCHSSGRDEHAEDLLSHPRFKSIPTSPSRTIPPREST